MGENIEMTDKTKPNVRQSLKRKFQSMSTKTRFKCGIRIAIIVMCVSGLTVQALELLKQYMRGTTVVNIKVEQIKYNKIPALTVCYPRFISMQRMRKLSPETYGTFFDNYRNIMVNVSRSEGKPTESVNKYLEELYVNNFTSIANEERDLHELFNLSIPFHFPRNSSLFNLNKQHDYAIDVKVNAIRLFAKNLTLDEIEIVDREPIESLVLPDGRQGFKCFTFFSQLRDKWRAYQIDLKEMHIKIYHNENWFPPSLYDGTMANIHLSMHSPNSIPQQMNVNNFVRLKAGKFYEITYNRWKTILLPPTYETMCREYDLYNNRGDYKLRSDCVNQCVYDKLMGACGNDCEPSRGNSNSSHVRVKRFKNYPEQNCSSCLYRSDTVWRHELLNRDGPLEGERICAKYDGLEARPVGGAHEGQSYARHVERLKCIKQNTQRINSECELKICRNECNNRFYNYNVKTSEKVVGQHPWSKYTYIQLAHNQLPDQITEHIPEISFIQFAGTFGGLMGMWMGLSALAILDFILNYL